MFINSVCYNPQCNSKNCKHLPSFGALRFTKNGMKALKAQIVDQVGNNVDLFVKEVKPLITRAEKNPVHVIVDKNPKTVDKLVAKVEDRKLKFGYDASTLYEQDDNYSYDFLAFAVDKAEKLNAFNKEFDKLPESIFKSV